MINVGLLLTARNQASSVLAQVQGSLAQVSATAKNLQTALDFAAVGAGIASIYKAYNAVYELGESSAGIERLGEAFGQLSKEAGDSSQSMMDSMKRASAGTISDAQLMQSANRAMLLGVADSATEMASLIEVARARGAAMGVASSKAFDDIVTGIGRLSPLILDNLGIMVDAETTYSAFAASIGKTVKELTDAEQKQALVNKVIAETQGLLGTAAARGDDAKSAYERWNVATANLREELGYLINDLIAGDGILVRFLGHLEEYLERGRTNRDPDTQMNDQMSALKFWQDKIDELNKQDPGIGLGAVMWAQQKAYAENMRDGAKAVIEMAEAQSLAKGVMNPTSMEMEAQMKAAPILAEHQRDVAASSQYMADMSKVGGNGLSYLASLAYSTGDAMDDLKGRLSGVFAQFNMVDQQATAVGRAIVGAASNVISIIGKDAALEMMHQQLGVLEDQKNAIADQSAGAAELQLNFEALSQTLTAPFEQIQDADRAAKQLAKTTSNDVTKAFDDLKSKVGGVVSGLFDPGVGVDPEEILSKLGMRPDAANEASRRLADIAVNGYKSPWVDYFKNEFPALFQEFFAGVADEKGLKGNAAAMLQNFQDGLLPQLIDKEQAKERVRRVLLGEQKTAELVQEIAEELASEMNQSLPQMQAKVGAILGSTNGGIIGASGQLGASLIGNVDAGQLKEQVISVLSTVMNDTGMAALAADGASTVGSSFATSFINTVGTQLTNEENVSGIFSRLNELLRNEGYLNSVKESGQQNGAAWGTGFLVGATDNIREPMLDLLTTLLLPKVVAGMATQDTLTGAR